VTAPAGAPAVGDAARRAVLVAATVTTGLAAGFFYTYEASVLRGLDRLDDAAFVTAMDALNDAVRNPLFALSFWGSLVLLPAAVAAVRERGPARALATVAAVAYALGVVAVTARYSLGLNADLGEALSRGTDPAAARAAFEDDWQLWNRVRAGAAALALSCMAGALLLVPEAGRRCGPPEPAVGGRH
jgi:uncharacterized membrane protein